MAVIAPPRTDTTPAATSDEEFTLDVRVVVAAHPTGKLSCDTSDGCGNTCQNASACVSHVGDPAAAY